MSTAPVQPLAEPELVELRAPLFRTLIDSLDDQRRHCVIDLGPARGSKLELLGRFRSRLDILDLPAELGLLDGLETDEACRRIDALFPPPRGEKADLVLCWNLLNYLQPALIELLMRRLLRRTTTGARVHALIEYSSTTMPDRPWAFEPQSAEVLAARPELGSTRPAPRYSSRELERRMPGFSHERTMLLGNGMQEYLFRRNAGGPD